MKKDGSKQAASADGFVGSEVDGGIILNVFGRPKHLWVYDLGLNDRDQFYQSPLLTFATLRPLENYRVRSMAAGNRRRGKWQTKVRNT